MARAKGSPKTGGRQKGGLNKATADVKALARVHTAAAIQELVRLMVKAESEAARVAAIKEILDRGHGKATTIISGDADNPIVHKVIREVVRSNAIHPDR